MLWVAIVLCAKPLSLTLFPSLSLPPSLTHTLLSLSHPFLLTHTLSSPSLFLSLSPSPCPSLSFSLSPSLSLLSVLYFLCVLLCSNRSEERRVEKECRS